MSRGKSIYKVLGLWALIVILTGCAAEKEPLITSPLSYDKLTEPTMPKYPGGTEKMFEFIATDIKVEKSIDPLFDKEAVRVVKTMPKWEPGMWNGKPARVKYCIPIRFRLAQNN